MSAQQSGDVRSVQSLPSLPLDDWESSKITLHMYLQIVGKIRLKLMPPQNHWWHVPLYVSSRGITTRPIPYAGGAFEIEVDLLDRKVRIGRSDGRSQAFDLQGQSVAKFYESVFGALDRMGIEVSILAKPFDQPFDTPFAEDREHSTFDHEYVGRYWQILLWAYGVMSKFTGRFLGKTTPVHLFWHSFDLALTRFSGRRAPVQEGAGLVEREAYSHEVISFGWWPGDANTREPMFYSYTAPEPAGIADISLEPEGAFWHRSNGSHLALYPYEAARESDDPSEAVLSFLESAYRAGATLAGWDVEDLNHGPYE